MTSPSNDLVSDPPSLFEAEDASPDDEVRRMLDLARALLDGDDPDSAESAAWRATAHAVDGAYELYQKGRLQLVAVEVAAALTAVVRPKNYGVRSVWEVALDLSGDEGAPDEDDFAFEEGDDELDEPEAQASSADEAPVSEASPEETALADRIGPIGAGGAGFWQLREARAVLWHNRTCGPAWEALCMAIDVVGAGSFASLDRLGVLADAAEDSPAILWLDEIACRLAREPARTERRAAAIDALLASGAFGKNAAVLARAVGLSREDLVTKKDRYHDAWLRVAAARRQEGPPGPAPGADRTPREEVAIQRAARQGDEVASLILDLERGIGEIVLAERDEEEHEGPFHGLHDVPRDVREVLDSASHWLFLGFRELHGLTLLRDALPRLAQALG